MKDNQYVLAMYDIRGKQDFIYKSSKMKEIIGASYMIRECFDDYLYTSAEQVFGKGTFCYKRESGPSEFTPEAFVRHLEEGYAGEVVYDGGGNFFVLYRDLAAYRRINQVFYRKLLEGTYAMRVLSTYLEGVDFEDYPGDQRKLYAIHRKNEQREDMLHPVNALPIVQVDYQSSLPLEAKCQTGRRIPEKVNYESKRKYDKYYEVMKRKSADSIIQGERLLDELVTEKGEESLLAVIYIDGNNMGAQVEACTRGLNSYEACVGALRNFSQEIQKYYIDDRIKDVDRILDNASSGKKDRSNRRFVVYAGDEVTFICNARNAYRVAVEYLEKLYQSSPKGTCRTSCAGIAIFHSHAPFADAYRIAEECCESGKQWMKKNGVSNAALLDFHYCQGAIGISLEEIRRQEETTDSSRPWLITGDAGSEKCKLATKAIVEKMREQLCKAGRSNIKNLLSAAKKSKADFEMELERIRAHQTGEKIDFTLGETLDMESIRRLVYDVVTVYDLWFDDSNEKGAN